EPDPGQPHPAELLATYGYRCPDPPPGCAGRNAEAMFLVDDVPYLIDKAEESTLYRFPRLDPDGTVTLEKVGVLAGQISNLSGADLSADRTRLAVDTHTALYIYHAGDPAADGAALVARPARRPAAPARGGGRRWGGPAPPPPGGRTPGVSSGAPGPPAGASPAGLRRGRRRLDR